MEATSTHPTRHVLLAALVVLATLTMMVATLADPGIAWDEGITIRRSQRIGEWFAEVIHPHHLPSRADAFRPEVIVDRSKPNDLSASYWPFIWVLEGHPPYYAVLVHLGWQVSHRWIEPLSAYRFGPALLFSMTTGIVFLSLARWYDLRAAATGVAALVFLPRLFAHAHFASYDVPVLCFWVLSTLAFVKAAGVGTINPSSGGPLRLEKRTARTARCGWTILFGLLLGLAFLTKFTGWLAPIPPAVWCLWYRDRRGLAVLGLGCTVALLTFYLLNPPLWHSPIEGLFTFLSKNLNRAGQGHLNIAGRFFGKNYDLTDPLPWYNTLVWVGITLPVGTLVLVLLGVFRVLYGRLRDRVGTLMLLSAGLLLAVRALPGSPPHDGIRLFLPSFAFLACLAGIGVSKRRDADVQATGERLQKSTVYRWLLGCPSWAVSGGIALLLSGSALSTWFYNPYQLSHYNLLIGGLPGAVRAGMEPTYYWDGMTEDVLGWLNANTKPENKVLFSSYDLSSKEGWRLLRRWEKLKPRVNPTGPGTTEWYVLQHRSSSYRPYDAWLVEHAEPAYVKRLHDRSRFAWGPYRLDVPLISIYDFKDLERAGAATEQQNSP